VHDVKKFEHQPLTGIGIPSHTPTITTKTLSVIDSDLIAEAVSTKIGSTPSLKRLSVDFGHGFLPGKEKQSAYQTPRAKERDNERELSNSVPFKKPVTTIGGVSKCLTDYSAFKGRGRYAQAISAYVMFFISLPCRKLTWTWNNEVMTPR
jgi:hypothetical protein